MAKFTSEEREKFARQGKTMPSGRKMEYVGDYIGQAGKIPYKFVER